MLGSVACDVAHRGNIVMGGLGKDALVPGGGLGPGLGPAAERLDQPAQKEPRVGNGQLSPAICQRLAHEAAQPPQRG
jgi:hypothetical protein